MRLHEALQLLKDMELLGTGVLTLSGHNHGDTKDSKMQQKSPGAEEILESKDPHLESSAVATPLTEKHETHSMAAGGNTDSAFKDLVCAHDEKEHDSKIGDKTMEQTVTKPQAGTKAAHHDTFLELEVWCPSSSK